MNDALLIQVITHLPIEKLAYIMNVPVDTYNSWTTGTKPDVLEERQLRRLSSFIWGLEKWVGLQVVPFLLQETPDGDPVELLRNEQYTLLQSHVPKDTRPLRLTIPIPEEVLQGIEVPEALEKYFLSVEKLLESAIEDYLKMQNEKTPV